MAGDARPACWTEQLLQVGSYCTSSTPFNPLNAAADAALMLLYIQIASRLLHVTMVLYKAIPQQQGQCALLLLLLIGFSCRHSECCQRTALLLTVLPTGMLRSSSRLLWSHSKLHTARPSSGSCCWPPSHTATLARHPAVAAAAAVAGLTAVPFSVVRCCLRQPSATLSSAAA